MDNGTPQFDKFKNLYAKDHTAWWRLDPGDQLNLFEEACDRLNADAERRRVDLELIMRKPEPRVVVDTRVNDPRRAIYHRAIIDACVDRDDLPKFSTRLAIVDAVIAQMDTEA